MPAVIRSVSPSEARKPPALQGLGPCVEEIYSAHFALAWRGLRRLGVPASAVEDAVQDVFLIVHRRWAEFEGRSSVKTWIYGIMLRVAKDHRRTEARHATRIAHLAEFAVANPVRPTGPAEDFERREANRLVHAVLGSLSDEDRDVLVLVELEQLSVRDAATALGIHVRACQRRLRAARIAFDAHLEPRLRPAGKLTP